jgi:hypothetical protein
MVSQAEYIDIIYYKKDSNFTNTHPILQKGFKFHQYTSYFTKRIEFPPIDILHYKKDSADINLAFSLISVYGFFHDGRFASTVFC